jgi:hypothetical protein
MYVLLVQGERRCRVFGRLLSLGAMSCYGASQFLLQQSGVSAKPAGSQQMQRWEHSPSSDLQGGL